MPDTYSDVLKTDSAQSIDYFVKSVNKTEQQKYLENLLGGTKNQSLKIADVACGGGTLSYHLKYFFPNSQFYLFDYLETALETAKKINRENDFIYQAGNIYLLDGVETGFFDYTFCWQTLSWLDEPQKALLELIRITKPAGKIYISSLFNLDHDVDLYTKVIDYTRESGKENLYMNYNTYSLYTINNWIKNLVQEFTIHKFSITIDLPPPPR